MNIKRIIIFTIVGATLGFIYYNFWGCDSGCDLKSSPTVTSLYGAGIGLILGFDTKREKK